MIKHPRVCVPGMPVVCNDPVGVTEVLVVHVKHVVHQLYLSSHVLDHEGSQNLDIAEIIAHRY